MKPIFYFFLFVLLGYSACRNAQKNQPNLVDYNFNSPINKVILPDTLNEVSGIAVLDSNRFVCIQDENGILFVLNATKNEITNQFVFNINGDYEGITKVGNAIFVLRSDGVLYKIENFEQPYFSVSEIQTNIEANNNEGLCYDEKNHRLLIAAKGKIGKGPQFKNLRVIYAFNLDSNKLDKNPAYEFDLEKIKKFALVNNPNIETKPVKKANAQLGEHEPIIKLMTSAIGIHPVTNKLYLLSAKDHMLFIFNAKGNLEHIEVLNPQLFNKAEGIAFYPNGDVVITNEAQNKNPTLLKFKFRQ